MSSRSCGAEPRKLYSLLLFLIQASHSCTYWSVGLGELEAKSYAERDNPKLAQTVLERLEARARREGRQEGEG